MDFFHGLGQGRYAVFKTKMLNGWAAGAFEPPDTVNKIFRLAGSWVKSVAKGEGGTAVSYVTLEDDAKKNNKRKQDAKRKHQKTGGDKKEVDTDAEGDNKTPKDRSNYKCWSCNEFGHLANSKLCPNYKAKKVANEAAVNGTEYEASMYTTVSLETKQREEHVVNNAVNMTKEVSLPRCCLITKPTSVLCTQHYLLMFKDQKKL
jgi:hypothetical protein